MITTKARHRSYYITRTAILLAWVLIFQIGFREFAQPVVGSLVNMILIIGVLKVGPAAATIIGCLTPLVAFLIGIVGLLPVVPFIMLGNGIFVCTFYFIRKSKGVNWDYIALGIAALMKFIFLAFPIRYLIILFIPQVPPPLIAALSLPQFYTALVGGFIAIVITRLFR